MNYATLESKGIKSKDITLMLKKFEKARLCTHDVIIARGNDIVFENYWAPFHKDYEHRQYSVTKSVVAIALGFLVQNGTVSLDDPIEKYFPDKISENTNYYLRRQTIRNMLNMSTAMVVRDWFSARSDDRVRFYFENDNPVSVPGGTLFKYDSTGTFVIGALIERVAGMELMDFLRLKLFDRIGVSKEATCLKCPGGHSWSDSALICTAQDLLKIARFTLNYGEWEGEQILNRDYLIEATSPLVPNNYDNSYMPSNWGYGYYIWMTYQNSFSFNGMGDQFAICVPSKDLIFIYNGDNQGRSDSKRIIFDSFFEYIVDNASDKSVAENTDDAEELKDTVRNSVLTFASGNYNSPTVQIINGKTYTLEDNRMGLKSVKLVFDCDSGCLFYVNEQGKKKIRFGLGKNEFGEFEQDGYSDIVGSEKGNRRYKCAASAAWISDSALLLKVQIIDTYFGNFNMILSFDGDCLAIESSKTAEDFLNEYYGRACGRISQ